MVMDTPFTSNYRDSQVFNLVTVGKSTAVTSPTRFDFRGCVAIVFDNLGEALE